MFFGLLGERCLNLLFLKGAVQNQVFKYLFQSIRQARWFLDFVKIDAKTLEKVAGGALDFS